MGGGEIIIDLASRLARALIKKLSIFRTFHCSNEIEIDI